MCDANLANVGALYPCFGGYGIRRWKDETIVREMEWVASLDAYRGQGSHGDEMQKPGHGLVSLRRDSSALQRKHAIMGLLIESRDNRPHSWLSLSSKLLS